MQLVEDRWLSKRFGFPAFRVELPLRESAASGGAQSDVAALHAELLLHRPTFCYAKIEASRVDWVAGLTDIGFRVVEANITFSRKPPFLCDDGGLRSDQVQIAPVLPTEHARVLELAESCFHYSRFHLDPCISDVLANQVKREWIQSYLNRERGEVLWGAHLRSEMAGFLAFLRPDKDRGVVDLLGVAPRHRRQGVGRALLRHCFAYCNGQNLSMEVGTQASNIPSIRLYEAMGLRAHRSQFVLHYHAAAGDRVSTCV